MSRFLLWIGACDFLGVIALVAMHNDRVADFFFRRASEIVPSHHRHEGYARMGLWWAAMTNLFLGVVGVYAIGWVAALVGMRAPRYARGRCALSPTARWRRAAPSGASDDVALRWAPYSAAWTTRIPTAAREACEPCSALGTAQRAYSEQ